MTYGDVKQWCSTSNLTLGWWSIRNHSIQWFVCLPWDMSSLHVTRYLRTWDSSYATSGQESLTIRGSHVRSTCIGQAVSSTSLPQVESWLGAQRVVLRCESRVIDVNVTEETCLPERYLESSWVWNCIIFLPFDVGCHSEPLLKSSLSTLKIRKKKKEEERLEVRTTTDWNKMMNSQLPTRLTTTTTNNNSNQKNTSRAATNIIPSRFDPSDLAKVANALCRLLSEMDVDQTYETMMMLMVQNSNKGYPLKNQRNVKLGAITQFAPGWNNVATAYKNVFQGNLKSPFLAFSMQS